MKYSRFIYLFLLLSALQAASQDTTSGIFQLKNIPENGVTLNKGWKFSPGDNPDWSVQNYNDDNWISIDPTKELHHSPEVRKSNIGWFRLKLQIDSSLLGKTLAFIVSNLGASEIYLNGQLIYKFGIVSSEYREEQTRFFSNQLLSLKLNNQVSQIIAVRHSFNKKNLYLKFTSHRPIIQIVLKEINQAFADHIKDNSFDSTLRSIQVSFYLPLGFLLLFLFFSFSMRREYLYTGVFCFCMFGAILMHILALSEPTTVSRSNYLLLVTQVLYIVGALSFINGIYILYNRKKSWFYYLIILYGLISLPLFFISYDVSGLFNACFFPVINFEFLRLNVQMVRRGRKGAWILLLTSLLLLVSLLCMVLLSFRGEFETSTFLQAISFIVPGIGLSFFYAGEFARTGSALRLRAIEVEELSKEMIAKEIEKQQILGSQNETLEKQVVERTSELRKSLSDLKEAEEQLIQREKMASLGELTAGIAHEIQNPLNFVNNFSEINTELIDELEQEVDKGDLDQVKAITKDIKENEQKINHHGKRADAIVKGMLQHSRSSSGVKEPTDINVLCDEYLRLSYHGLRAKDKLFNATMKTDFDKSLERISVLPQDLGRVILNLLTNAFYAVNEKKHASTGSAGQPYEPTVSVSTKKMGDKVEIRVSDNGNGIPQKVLDKIFQPFFTTKPTGQGTGLGLSLSYDIIIKGHGGELKVETKEGEGTNFIIILPA